MPPESITDPVAVILPLTVADPVTPTPEPKIVWPVTVKGPVTVTAPIRFMAGRSDFRLAPGRDVGIPLGVYIHIPGSNVAL